MVGWSSKSRINWPSLPLHGSVEMRLDRGQVITATTRICARSAKAEPRGEETSGVSMKTIRWGMIGAGDVTEVKSGPGFYKARNSELVAVMRRNGPLAHPAGEQDARARKDSHGAGHARRGARHRRA